MTMLQVVAATDATGSMARPGNGNRKADQSEENGRFAEGEEKGPSESGGPNGRTEKCERNSRACGAKRIRPLLRFLWIPGVHPECLPGFLRFAHKDDCLFYRERI